MRTDGLEIGDDERQSTVEPPSRAADQRAMAARIEKRLIEIAALRGRVRPYLSPFEAKDLRQRVWRALLTGTTG